MVAAGVVLVYALFSFFEIVSLVKTKRKKELIVFIIFISIAFIMSMLLAFGVDIPSIERIIGDFVTSITGE